MRQQAGAGEEVLVDVLDLDTVTRVRTVPPASTGRGTSSHGTAAASACR
ncbi:hypothetical protein [Streptomyces sp. NPDC058620]